MGFPLFKLPAVPLAKILLGFTSSELFDLHQCSHKTGNILKQYEKKNKTMKATVDFQRNFVDIKGVRRYNIRSPEEFQGNLPEEKRIFDGKEVPTESVEGNVFNTVWPTDEKVEGTKKITTDLIRSLGLGQLQNLLISDEIPAQDVIEWVGNSGVKMENFTLMGTAPEHRDTLADLVYSDEFFRKVSMNFTSLLEVSPEFSPKNLKVEYCITLFKLCLHHSHWFTIDHLMAFNSGAIILYHSTLSSADLRKYLSHWKDGNYTQLAYLSIDLADGHQFSIREVIADLFDPQTIRTEGNGEIIELKRSDKIGELTINQAKNEIRFMVDDVPK